MLRVALTQAAPMRRGARVQARLVEPVYQRDRLLWPSGTPVQGEVDAISRLTVGQRLWAAAQGVLSPPRTAEVRFDTVLPVGESPIHVAARAIRGAREVVELQASGVSPLSSRSSRAGSLAGRARQAAAARVHQVRTALSEPQRWKRLQTAVDRAVVEQLPYRPQHLAAGSQYVVELQQTVAVPVAPPASARLAAPPPQGTTLHASLLEGLSSARNHSGDAVSAVLLRPLQLQGGLLPAGTILAGRVVQAAPSRAFGRNGSLRFNFDRLMLSDGQQFQAPATVQGAAVDRDAHLRLDHEGGATVAPSAQRYLLPALAVVLAAQAGADDENGAGRSGGLGLLGMATTLLARSHPVSVGLAAVGASLSVYRHLLAPGREVVFPRGTELEVQMGRTGR